jgi:hypothetical protein
MMQELSGLLVGLKAGSLRTIKRTYDGTTEVVP